MNSLFGYDILKAFVLAVISTIVVCLCFFLLIKKEVQREKQPPPPVHKEQLYILNTDTILFETINY